MPTAGTHLDRLAARAERLSAVDPLIDTLAAGADRALRPAWLKNLLSGTWLGHPLHPLATDAVIGAWAMAAILDIGGRNADAAERVLGLGIVAALPTAAAGVSDWADTHGEGVRRMGLVHAASNVAALSLNTASYLARKAGRRRLGRRLTAASGLPLAVGGFLGAHMVYAREVGVRRAPATDGAYPMCTHCGARLVPDAAGEALRCPRDGSAFRASDGAVLDGPATTPMPRVETSGG